MSWTQGIQEASELPQSLRDFLNSKSEGTVECISWYPEERGRFTAHYYRGGEFLEALAFSTKKAPD